MRRGESALPRESAEWSNGNSTCDAAPDCGWSACPRTDDFVSRFFRNGFPIHDGPDAGGNGGHRQNQRWLCVAPDEGDLLLGGKRVYLYRDSFCDRRGHIQHLLPVPPDKSGRNFTCRRVRLCAAEGRERRTGQTADHQGYDGIGSSLGVKFDTYKNTGEINDNHVAIQTNGVEKDEFSATPYMVPVCTSPVGVRGCMSNGDLWSVWIDYDGLNLHVALADNSTVRPADLIDAPLSLPMALDYATAAYAGFTAGTGGGYENHDIVNWEYYNTYSPTPVGTKQVLPGAASP